MNNTQDQNSRITEAQSTALPNNFGLLLKDRYLIERELGRGGLGVVYLARDTQLVNRAVVIKVLVAEGSDERYNLWYQRKFKQEMEALARINHPGVVGVFDTGEMPDGKPFLVMQFVEGQTLRSVMILPGMEFGRVANIVRQMGQALTAAHEKGVFHRDLKPENIMLEDLGRGHEQVKLIDFGVARITDSEVGTNADVTWIAGTLPYMAPEQLRGRPTAESDVYGFGAVVYEMLTGQPPFKASSAVDLYELQREGAIKSPKELRTNLPDKAEAAVLKALSFDAKDRYESARDFAEDLAAALSGEDRQSDPQAPTIRLNLSTAAAEGRSTAIDDTQIYEPSQPHGKPGIRWMIAALLLLLAGFGAWRVYPLFRNQPKVNVAASPVRLFSYWMMVQKYRNGQSYQAPFKSAGDINFEPDDRIRLYISSAKEGYLYIINEGPKPLANGLPDYNTLFPSPTANNGSSLLAMGKQITIPEAENKAIFFDEQQGTEKLWLVWSAKSLPELEALKSLINPQDRSEIKNPIQIQSVRDLLAQSRTSQSPAIEVDDANTQTNIKGAGDVIVHLVRLSHH